MNWPLDEKYKKKIIALVNALAPDAKIYLYGSRARGTNNEWSDIDIALDADKPIERLTIGELRDIMEASNLPYNVDIVDVHNISPEMYNSIMRDKIVWKKN